MPRYPLKPQDVTIKAFRDGGGPGGQAKNKTENCIRATHKPTGITVEAKSERSQSSNKANALKLLQAKLDKYLEDKIKEVQQSEYQAKLDPSFGSQIRTYRLCGNEQVTIDHRTGVKLPTGSVLNGELDDFIKLNLKGS